MYRNGHLLETLGIELEKCFADRKLTIGSLAGFLGMSERQLQRLMRQAAGMSPSAYLRQYRLQRARGLLEDGRAVGDVADAVGFSSHAYFSCCFKTQFGVTPRRYRAQARSGQRHTDEARHVAFGALTGCG